MEGQNKDMAGEMIHQLMYFVQNQIALVSNTAHVHDMLAQNKYQNALTLNHVGIKRLYLNSNKQTSNTKMKTPAKTTHRV